MNFLNASFHTIVKALGEGEKLRQNYLSYL